MKANEEFATEVTHLYEEEEKWREEKQKLEQSLADTKVELSNQIFVPNNVPQELSLRVTNLPDLAQHHGETKFMCQVEIEEIILSDGFY